MTSMETGVTEPTIGDVREAIQDFSGRIDGRFDGLEHRMDRMEGRMDKVEQRLDGVDQRLDGMERKIDRVDGKVNALVSVLQEKRMITEKDKHGVHACIRRIGLSGPIFIDRDGLAC